MSAKNDFDFIYKNSSCVDEITKKQMINAIDVADYVISEIALRLKLANFSDENINNSLAAAQRELSISCLLLAGTEKPVKKHFKKNAKQ